MPRGTGLPGQNVDCNDAPSGNKGQAVCQIFPKDWYTWTDRLLITTPDVTGPLSTSALPTPISCADAGMLVIAADGTTASANIGITVVLWDERGNPIGGCTNQITLSGWLTNAAGNYPGINGLGTYPPGFLQIDVSNAAAFNILVQSITGGTINLHWKLF